MDLAWVPLVKRHAAFPAAQTHTPDRRRGCAPLLFGAVAGGIATIGYGVFTHSAPPLLSLARSVDSGTPVVLEESGWMGLAMGLGVAMVVAALLSRSGDPIQRQAARVLAVRAVGHDTHSHWMVTLEWEDGSRHPFRAVSTKDAAVLLVGDVGVAYVADGLLWEFRRMGAARDDLPS